MKKFSSKSQKIGETGENIACTFLVKQGFEIIERNFTEKWGEIDIIARKSGVSHFIEVKSASCESFDRISHETDSFRPEDQMHRAKLKRLSRTIQSYLARHETDEWSIDLVCVFLNQNTRMARAKILENIIL